MPLFITPRQLKQRSDWYHQLASFTSTGVGLMQGLEFSQQSHTTRSFRKPLGRILDSLQRGSTFSEALEGLGPWLPEFDVALIEAGEKSGRLDASFRLLSDYYRERSVLLQGVISDLAYPVFILHFAVFIFPPTHLTKLVFEGDVLGFFWPKLEALFPFYGAVILLAYFCQGRHGERWRGVLERASRFIPLLGRARSSLSLARLSAALEGLLNAGVSVIEAWELAASASGSPALQRAVRGWSFQVRHGGKTPGEMVDESGAFPELFSSLYRTGEFSGQLDSTLRRLYDHYREEGTRKLTEFSQWTPRLVYIGILCAIGYQIVSFWSGYYANVSAVME